MNPDLHMERPLTRRECHNGLNRQERLEWGNLFKEIASALERDDTHHLALGDFPVSESKIKLARMSPRWLYAYVAKRSGMTTDEIMKVLNVKSRRVSQLLGKVQIKICTIEKVVGKPTLEAFLDRHSEEIMRSLEEVIKEERLECIRTIEWWGDNGTPEVSEPLKPMTSFFYISDGYDVFERFNHPSRSPSQGSK